MKTHNMIDFETLGVRPNSAVLSLGWVKFNRDEILEEHEWVFNLKEQIRLRPVDSDTLCWWLKQSEHAKAVFDQAQNSLTMLNEVLRSIMGIYNQGEKIWGNGATFDPPILENMFQQAQIPIPWKYWDVGCFRTLKPLMPKAEKAQVAHCALEDAKAQALRLMHVFREYPILDA